LGGAELLCYPTAIGSEPDYPNFDTEPLLRQVVVGHAIANGLFIVIPNRFGSEGTLEFYGSSFIVDPLGRVLAQAPKDEEATLVVDIDLGLREDWLTLFPFFGTRRPDTYSALTEALQNPRQPTGEGLHGGIPGLTS
jgi:N-carbamoylputrescine amidase